MTVTQLHPDKADFNEFWKHYPLKRGKADARDLFNLITRPGGFTTKKAMKDSGQVVGMVETHLEATPEELVEGAKRFARSLVKVVDGKWVTDTKYCRHATTWLHHRGWEDCE